MQQQTPTRANSANTTAAILTLIVSVALFMTMHVHAFSAVSPLDSAKSNVGRCYAWKLRVKPAQTAAEQTAKAGTETIISSRCKTELPACKVVMEVLCKGGETPQSDSLCVPCKKTSCSDMVPVCRWVSRAYSKGDCDLSVPEPCQVSMKKCAERERLLQQYKDRITTLCPQSTEGVDLKFRIEPIVP